MKLRWRLVVSAIACLAVGCGSAATGSSHPAVGTAFARRAIAVCTAASAEKKALGAFPYPSFNPTQPDASKLPGIARFEVKLVTIFKRWQGKMHALGNPPTGRTAWASVLRALDSHTRSTIQQQAAAQRGDTKAFTNTYYANTRASSDILSAATAAGVPQCAAPIN